MSEGPLRRSETRSIFSKIFFGIPSAPAGSTSTLLVLQMRHKAVRVSFGSPMVQRYRYDDSWGPKKIVINFAVPTDQSGRPRQRNPVNPWRRGLPGAAQGRYWTRAIAYSAYAAAYIGRYISVQVPSQLPGQSPSPPSFGSRALRRAPRTGACGLGDYPTIDLSQRESESRSAPEKSK